MSRKEKLALRQRAATNGGGNNNKPARRSGRGGQKHQKADIGEVEDMVVKWDLDDVPNWSKTLAGASDDGGPSSSGQDEATPVSASINSSTNINTTGVGSSPSSASTSLSTSLSTSFASSDSSAASTRPNGWLWGSITSGSTRQRLQEQGLKAKKSLGQNFVTDDDILRRIVESCDLARGDLVLEVGPGTGNLTRHIIETGAKVLCVEKDTALFEQLLNDVPDDVNDRVRLINLDVLRLDIPGMVQTMNEDSFWDPHVTGGIDASEYVKLRVRGASRLYGTGHEQEDDQSAADLEYALRQQHDEPRTDADGWIIDDEDSDDEDLGLLSEEDDVYGDEEDDEEDDEGGAHILADTESKDIKESRETPIAQSGLSPSSPPQRRVKVIANLPYNITTDFMKRCLPQGLYLSDLYLMLQHEVAERLTRSKRGSADYRAINIQTILFSKPRYGFFISRTAFFPSPRVDSALAIFSLRAPEEIPELGVPVGRFLSDVQLAFSSRRKMIRNNMKGLYGAKIEDALNEAGLELNVRAQDMTVADFVKLSRALR